jgi:hypothetical protein
MSTRGRVGAPGGQEKREKREGTHPGERGELKRGGRGRGGRDRRDERDMTAYISACLFRRLHSFTHPHLFTLHSVQNTFPSQFYSVTCFPSSSLTGTFTMLWARPLVCLAATSCRTPIGTWQDKHSKQKMYYTTPGTSGHVRNQGADAD